MVTVTMLVSVYYCVIIAYSLFYMFASFQSPLPWSACSSWADGNHSNSSAGALTLVPEASRFRPLVDTVQWLLSFQVFVI